jgi:hypothetical protein
MLAYKINSLDRSTKSTPSHPKMLRLLVGTEFQVLFHSPPGVLFTFPSRYSFTIDRNIFSLGRWSSRIQTGFLVPRPTRETTYKVSLVFVYAAFTLYG